MTCMKQVDHLKQFQKHPTVTEDLMLTEADIFRELAARDDLLQAMGNSCKNPVFECGFNGFRKALDKYPLCSVCYKSYISVDGERMRRAWRDGDLFRDHKHTTFAKYIVKRRLTQTVDPTVEVQLASTDTFPAEIISHILSFVPWKTLHVLLAVNRNWNRYVRRTLRLHHRDDSVPWLKNLKWTYSESRLDGSTDYYVIFDLIPNDTNSENEIYATMKLGTTDIVTKGKFITSEYKTLLDRIREHAKQMDIEEDDLVRLPSELLSIVSVSGSDDILVTEQHTCGVLDSHFYQVWLLPTIDDKALLRITIDLSWETIFKKS